MEINLHTYELQDIVIALICSHGTILDEKPETKRKLIDMFAGLNNLCTVNNDYTISLEVKS